MRRYQPLRRIVGTHKEPVSDEETLAWLRGIGSTMTDELRRNALKGERYHVYDVLECGHRLGAVFAPGAHETPYVRLEDGNHRKCPNCPRVEVS